MRGAIVLVAIALVAIGAPARAQSAKAAAETAFRKGKELMAAGKTAEACAAFEESEKLDPQLGTQYNLALCDEQLGKLTSAWINFSEVAAKDAAGPRKRDAGERAKALEPRLARVVVVIDDARPGETVQLGSLDVTALIGTAMPLDPGEYELHAAAPGGWRWLNGERHVVKVEAGTRTIHVPPLAQELTPPPPRKEDAPARGHGRRIAGLVVGGAGVAAIGVGLFFGWQASDLKSRAETACGGMLIPCAPLGRDEAQGDINDARDKALYADVAVGVGAAALITGVVLYATAPARAEHAEVAPLIGPDRVGLAIGGRF